MKILILICALFLCVSAASALYEENANRIKDELGSKGLNAQVIYSL